MLCYTFPERGLRWVTPPVSIDFDKDYYRLKTEFRALAAREGVRGGDCDNIHTRSGDFEIPEYHRIGTTVNVGNRAEPFPQRIVAFPDLKKDWFRASGTVAQETATAPTKNNSAKSPDGRLPSKEATPNGTSLADTRREQREEEDRKDAIAQEKKEQQARAEAVGQAEIASLNQKVIDGHKQQADANAASKADYDRKMAEHVRSVAKADAEKQEYERQLAANAAQVAAHKTAMDSHSKLVSKSSTNDDPNLCVTRSETKLHDGGKGNTSVSVINGCGQKINIQLCLQEEDGGWSCGARFGILPQSRATHSSYRATGEVFVDAVSFDSSKKLARPSGRVNN